MTRELVKDSLEGVGVVASECAYLWVVGVSSSILVGVLVEGVFEVEDPHRLDEPGEPVSPARWRLLRESARGLLP